jgi:DNA-binding MarR family transcriptional regulator
VIGDASEQTQFAAALVRLCFLVQRVYAQTSRDHDLTPQQAKLVCVLLSGPVCMAELGESLSLEKSSLTGLVDRTEQRGYVARARNTDDRRVWMVELTTAGEALARRFHGHVIERVQALADLDPADRQHATKVVNQILGDDRVSGTVAELSG